jgi:hypothetical protein
VVAKKLEELVVTVRSLAYRAFFDASRRGLRIARRKEKLHDRDR